MKVRRLFITVLGMFVAPVLLSANGTDTSGVQSSSIEMIEAEISSEVIRSFEIVQFENDEIPVDSARFYTHVNQLEFEIPLDFNSEVKRFIDFFGTTWQPKLKEMMTVSEQFFPIYEGTMDKYNIPLELKYISVIESALNPYATSGSGAVGVWQFMPYTGKIFDLNIDRYLDERRDIVKATEAAAQYFHQMSQLYDDWLVVIASYNCGPGNVNKAIRRAGGKTGFWEIYPYLPKQTRNYIPSFIAVAYLMNYGSEYGIVPSPVASPNLNLSKVICTPDHNLEAISEVLGISVDSIKSCNPHLKVEYLPRNQDATEINLPEDLCYCFLEEEERILELSKTKAAAIIEEYHVVRRGESLGAISRKYGCSVRELKEWNNLRSELIHPGQKLIMYL